MLELTDSLSVKSQTAKLWLQYIKYVNIVKDFIRAERTGDWNLAEGLELYEEIVEMDLL
jgi:hypothetical protein